MKAPAFQFYPQDFISSLDVQVMTVEQIGGYWLLLTNAWIHEPQGYLPNNDLLLQRICRMNDKQWSKNKSLILKKFEKAGEFIFNARLLKELEKQAEYRKKQAQNGAKGGRPKANDNPEKPTAFSGETQTEPKKSSSFSSSTSSSFSSSTSSSFSSSTSDILLEKESKAPQLFEEEIPEALKAEPEKPKEKSCAKKEKVLPHFFEDSPYYHRESFVAYFTPSHYPLDKYPDADIEFYYEKVKHWAEYGSGIKPGKQRSKDWAATGRTFMRRDSDESKLKIKSRIITPIRNEDDAYSIKRYVA